MAFRVRVLHSIVLSVVGASFIVYSSYYANPVQLYRIEQPHQGKSTLPHERVQVYMVIKKPSSTQRSHGGEG
ncbi:hypothetical protein J6590_045351 [Homalodisca vitripennis]|nr:hypothetical protein J6590_045351 [Homalodisca vitripennis]